MAKQNRTRAEIAGEILVNASLNLNVCRMTVGGVRLVAGTQADDQLAGRIHRGWVAGPSHEIEDTWAG
jgi:hypothetical protein